jgi:type III secretory pathway component EscS
MKPFYASKTLWLAFFTFLSAIIPAVAAFVKVIDPNTAVIVDSVVLLVASIVGAIIRIFFTDTVIETPARMQTVYPTPAEQVKLP